MDQLVDNITTIKVTPRRRRGGGGYCFPIGCRAAYAADMVKERGWSAKRAAALFCVSPTYLGLALKLGVDDQGRLARGELKLSDLHKDNLRRLFERRARRLAEDARPGCRPSVHARSPQSTVFSSLSGSTVWSTAS